jgi:hypothetical protein
MVMNTLKFEERDVVDFMGEGRHLAYMHTNSGKKFFLVPGGPIKDDVAAKVIARKDIYPACDGLFPGITQTYVLRRRH